MSSKKLQLAPALQVPDASRAVMGGADCSSAIRRECHAQNAIRMSFEPVYFGSEVGQAPKADDSVTSGRECGPSVRRKRHAVDGGRMPDETPRFLLLTGTVCSPVATVPFAGVRGYAGGNRTR